MNDSVNNERRYFSEKLTEAEVDKHLGNFYYFRHRLLCFKYTLTSAKRKKLFIEMLSIIFVVIGTTVGTITNNPIVLGCLNGASVILQTYSSKSSISERVENTRSAYRFYKKSLSDVRGFLRGDPYDEDTFTARVKIHEELIINSCSPIPDKVIKMFIDVEQGRLSGVDGPPRGSMSTIK